MGKLAVRKLCYDVQEGTFDCGNGSINRCIYESYYPTLLQHAYAFQVLVDDIIVGYYMIGFERYLFDDDALPEEVNDYRSTIVNTVPAIYVKYIAIQKEFQNRKIGSSLLKYIVDRVFVLCKDFPVSIITLDALKEKYQWYKKNGFLPIDENAMRDQEPTIKMYMKCILATDDVNDYINNNK